MGRKSKALKALESKEAEERIKGIQAVLREIMRRKWLPFEKIVQLEEIFQINVDLIRNAKSDKAKVSAIKALYSIFAKYMDMQTTMARIALETEQVLNSVARGKQEKRPTYNIKKLENKINLLMSNAKYDKPPNIQSNTGMEKDKKPGSGVAGYTDVVEGKRVQEGQEDTSES